MSALSTTIDEKLESSGPVPFHWTTKELYRALNAGIFGTSNRIELIQGELLEKASQNPPHAWLVTALARRFRRSFEDRFCIRNHAPLHLSDDSEPEPDILVAAGNDSDYDERHPTPENAALVIEVADMSVLFDTREKALLYSQAGIADYWVFLLPTQELLVHRQPTADGYADVQKLAVGENVSPLCAPDKLFAVALLFSKEAELK